MKFLLGMALFTLAVSCGHEKRSATEVKRPVQVTAARMQDLVIEISRYAKTRKPGFLIVPQNASKLVYEKGDPYSRRHAGYFDAIDAIGIEGLFYNGTLEPDSLRIAVLDTFARQKKVFISDYVVNKADAPSALEMIRKHGFVPMVRTPENFDYVRIPGKPAPRGVRNIAEVTNYLYLINGSRYADKQSFIEAVSGSGYQLAIIDLFFHGEAFTADEIAQMRKLPGGGQRILLGYVNIGAAENWRHYWKKDWKIGAPGFLHRPYHGYKDEAWVKFWDPAWKQILAGKPSSYVDMLIAAGFDGAYLDNVEAYLYLYSNE